VHLGGHLAQQVEEDGDVVRGQAPKDVLVLAHPAQVHPARLQVEDLAQRAGLHDGLELFDGRHEQGQVSHHQGPPPTPRQLDQVAGLLAGHGHGLFQEDRESGLQRLAGQLIVGHRRGGDGHGLEGPLSQGLVQ